MQENDEISLYDIWLMLARHKKLFWAVFAVVLIVGMVFTITKPKEYSYTQVLQAARYMNDNHEMVNVISSAAVIDKIRNIYLPIITKEYNATHPNEPVSILDKSVKIEAIGGNRNDDGFISLSIKGPVANATIYKYLFANILKKLKTDTGPLVAQQKELLKKYLHNSQQYMQQQQFITKKLGHAANDSELMQQAILLSGQANANVSLLQNIANIKSKLRNLQESRFVSGFVQSNEPVGISKLVLMILVVFISLVLGIILVLMSDFLGKVKKSNNK